jgi:hypothetical protein
MTLNAQKGSVKSTLPSSSVKEWRCSAALAGPNAGAEKEADLERPMLENWKKCFPHGK